MADPDVEHGHRKRPELVNQGEWPCAAGFDGEQYAARIAALAATGRQMHGEASLCSSLVAPPARILDAGCGTGRVAARLAELGFDCVGVDVDASMLAVAQRVPGVRWLQADLATLDLPAAGIPDRFELIVAAGNVFPFLAPGTGPAAVRRLAGHLRPGAFLVAGFGLDHSDLPEVAVLIPIEDYDAWCVAAGLELVSRYASWAAEPWTGGSYAVSVHRLPATRSS